MVSLMSSSKRSASNVVPMPMPPPAAPPAADPALLLVVALQQQIATLQQQFVTMDGRLRALELERATEAASHAASTAQAHPATTITEHRARDREEILRALDQTSWNRMEAARILGMPRRTFYRRMEEYGLQQGDTRKKPSA